MASNGRRKRALSVVSDGARLTYTDLLASAAPQNPPTEEYSPEIFAALKHPAHFTVAPPKEAQPDDEVPPIFLLRKRQATHAYARIPRPPIDLNHHGNNWGCVLFGVMFPRVSSTTFQAPSSKTARYVAIKQLRRSVVDEYLRTGGEENPYKEIARMQELGDDVHVLSCIEALQDDQYLYIITPMACGSGTLKDAIPWLRRQPMDPDRARELFIQILNILLYLEQHGICHRDLSPDNFLFLSPNRLVAFDLALSLRVPKDENGQRTLIRPQGNFGTRAYMPPEIYMDAVFDSVGSDLWAVAVILYNLTTNLPLYLLPHPADLSFRYFVLARALSSDPPNERAVEILQTTFQPGNEQKQHDLLLRAEAHLKLDPNVREILEHVFHVDPARRWTLAQVWESAYVRGEDEY